MFRGLEKLWSSSRAGPATLPLSPKPGYGVWSVAFGPAGDHADPEPHARRAVYSGAKTATLWLTVRTPAGGVLRLRSISGVAPHSALDTAARLAAKANGLTSLFAAKTVTLPPEAFFVMFARCAALSVAEPAPDESDRPRRARHALRLIREGWNDLFRRKQWRLLAGAADAAGLPRDLREIAPPADEIWADPFLFTENGDTRVFFEAMTFGGHGRIASAGLREDGTLGEARTVLATDSHLSYPQVFRHAGALWMTAESAASKRLVAYRCVRFPDRWEAGPTVFGGAIIDPSVFEHDGRWWLAGNLAAGPGAKADDDLHLFYANDPFSGNWTPHPLNPVVCDARHARGAGRPFVRNGKLYRPAQDCAGVYGGRIVLREIVRLTREDFAEKTAATIGPESLPVKGAFATHTLNVEGDRAVSDFATRVPRRR